MPTYYYENIPLLHTICLHGRVTYLTNHPLHCSMPIMKMMWGLTLPFSIITCQWKNTTKGAFYQNAQHIYAERPTHYITPWQRWEWCGVWALDFDLALFNNHMEWKILLRKVLYLLPNIAAVGIKYKMLLLSILVGWNYYSLLYSRLLYQFRTVHIEYNIYQQLLL